ncbi:hypothetical protein OsI_39020 [Oryza sativa Indica Group]|uniref:Uncharacterized protein n=2 Tax=Oryza sativa TaxID=4530 RepID=A3CJ75_ORYSJ|nr:hypothetical protein OsI_39020 [Oryza sativa Indica Group]EAZ21138.1 hypothetical protein OsJ_36785 [Oryza sativa Japonica Group]
MPSDTRSGIGPPRSRSAARLPHDGTREDAEAWDRVKEEGGGRGGFIRKHGLWPCGGGGIGLPSLTCGGGAAHHRLHRSGLCGVNAKMWAVFYLPWAEPVCCARSTPLDAERMDERCRTSL